MYQLKVHLEKYALQVFHVLPEEKQKDYDAVVKKLKGRFRSVDIEELKGMKFHQKMQKGESVEQLGIDLLDLGRKAFPKITGTEFDRIMKGRFFQALHTKWQRKLGAPKPAETFSELYDRARTCERHEQQFTETALARGAPPRQPTNNQAPSRGRNVTPSGGIPFQRQNNNDNRGGSPRPRDGCFKCGDPGHIARYCPRPVLGMEAHGRSGRSPPQRTNVVTTSPPLTEQQLEKMLAKCRLEKEQALLEQASASNTADVHTVTTSNSTARVHPLA